MDIGKLTTRITIEAPAVGRDEANQPVNGWTPVRQLWADVVHKSGLQTMKSDAPASVIQASIRIRWRTDITSAMRVRIGDSVYGIEAVLPDRRGREFLDLVCEMVAGHG